MDKLALFPESQLSESVIEHAVEFIKTFFQNEYSGHDYYHSLRVYQTARRIAESEGADVVTVSLAALLHDVDDIKLSPETYEKKDNAVAFLKNEKIPDTEIGNICRMIDEVSFSGGSTAAPSTLEGKCVQDADRLDALGAIGIARTFAYGGNHNREIYNPAVQPVFGMSKDEYRNHVSTSLNHFYEKLFLLKDKMNTQSAYAVAERREMYMRQFVEEFLSEWNGEDCVQI